MKTFICFVIVVLASLQISGQKKPVAANINNLPNLGYRKLPQNAFASGERIEYLIHYGFIDAGNAILEIKDGERINGRETYKIIGIGKSLGSFDWFFKVRDHYETHLDKEGIFPHRFIRECDEGGYQIHQDYTFYQDRRGYKDRLGKTYMAPDFVQDMISAFYYARTIDFTHAQPGEIFTIQTLVDDEYYPLKIKFICREVVSTKSGKFRCLKFAPVVQKGRVFKKEEDLSVWITDDKNLIPVLAQAKIMVGSIKMELTRYDGLRNPIAKL
ncbi:MAG: DUF3108 domain-containing protein [Flavobacteriales bacterium]